MSVFPGSLGQLSLLALSEMSYDSGLEPIQQRRLFKRSTLIPSSSPVGP